MREARTLCQRATVGGRGLQSGLPVAVQLLPSRHPGGIRLLDARTGEWLSASAANLQPRTRTLEIAGARSRVVGVEHLLAACHGLGVCCLSIVVEGNEAPGLDGSARGWVHAMDRAGLTPCGGESRLLRGQAVSLEGEAGSSIRYTPWQAETLEISYGVDFSSHGGAREELQLVLDETTFRRELAEARTFAVRGVDPGTLPGVEPPPLWTDTPPAERRFPDELVRHKVLDLLGDLALVGRPIAGRVEAHRAGHGLHQQLAIRLAEAA